MSGLEAIWWRERPGPLGALAGAPLLLAEAPFRAAAALRGALYDRGVLPAVRAGAPVVSIGNLAVGGAGKTPAALAVAARLAGRGRRVAILSRGYGAARADARVASDGAGALLPAAEAGDEPALLARRLPGVAVLCGPRRAELARTAVEALGADALVLDDGFQHRALARDLDVVVLDASNPFGNGHLLPRGPNREPRTALRRAGLVWLSHADRAAPERLEALRRLARDATGRAPVESRHAPTALLDGALREAGSLEALRGRRVAALSGLARPAGFLRTLEALGAEVALARAFPDHHRFTGGELEAVLRDADAAGCAWVVTTEKDAVRLDAALAAAAADRLRVVRVDAELLRGADVLEAALDAALAAAPQPRPAPRAPVS
ncbi:tetraacyldisaccharide 4'-kinase [Anaeromyxobacter sp. K]|uniref:Tetraacyldisaccharide 4'-kinase n=1 Tax=Anaeromyxobacter sp. (strain K) TaxID=447217 RepID=LPXK_ANASK|nr:tetraacyldisaccharide 4'-kinase [Anaeromyxobacter sp. K]B4UHQ4.1 RecName: Full=Tetraacyldisaccharide 4'-kinase; AltName: Full=Lipid A 4'-kinase [Anaeromyxobacter sp. K]ACG73924.1 tetraacyldisaccharide 4'-kinase [Anaeromyxobacter sp. K]